MEENGRDDGDLELEAERRDAEEADDEWRHGRRVFVTSLVCIRGGIVGDETAGE